MKNDSIKAKSVRLGRRGFPTTAIIECTYQCNASCDYCYVSKNQSHMHTVTFLSALEKLNDAGILKVVFTGGEPFVRHDILQILDKAFSLNFFQISLMTNALAFTPQHLSYLYDHAPYIHGISVSIFSSEPELNDSIFGVKNALHTALNNCDILLKAGIPVKAKINLRPDNLHAYKNTRAELEKRGYRVEVFPYTSLMTKDTGQSSDKDHLRHFSQCLDILGEEYVQFKGKTNNSNSLCTGIHTTITLNPMGQLRPCVAFSATNFGNILEPRPLHQILNTSKKLQKIKSLRKSDIVSCKSCPYFDECLPCIAHLYNYDQTLKRMPPLFCQQVHCGQSKSKAGASVC